MNKNTLIKNAKDLDVKWAKLDKFQSVTFYMTDPEETSEKAIDYLCEINELLYEDDENRAPKELINFNWESGIYESYFAATLPSGERLYYRNGEYNGLQLLARTSHSTSNKVDYYFLQKLFSGGFNTNILDFPPDGITFGIPAPWDYVVDIVYSAIESANLWELLQERFSDTLQKNYDDTDFIHITSPVEEKVKQQLEENFWAKYGIEVSIERHQTLGRFIDNGLEKYIKKITPDYRLNSIPDKSTRNTLTDKFQIIERYLNKVL